MNRFLLLEESLQDRGILAFLDIINSVVKPVMEEDKAPKRRQLRFVWLWVRCANMAGALASRNISWISRQTKSDPPLDEQLKNNDNGSHG
jgi:hypothetical protein